MAERVLLLNDIDSVRSFVSEAMMQPFDIELKSGRYTVDAKSIMGVFSLDLTKPVVVAADCDESSPFMAVCDRYSDNKK